MFVGTHIQRHKDKTTAIALQNCRSRPEKSTSAKQKKYASTPPTTNHSFLMTNKLSKYQNFPTWAA
jgi:hypothetical protein